MKIGILTVFDAVNYGSYLQAYCLQKVLNDNGYDDISMIKDSSYLYEKWRITSLMSYIPQKIKFKGKLALGYIDAWKAFKKGSVKDKYDLVIVGSDEMWEVNNITMRPRPSFWGIGLNTNHLVSYAVSSNTTTTADTKKYTYIAQGVKKFEKVSVRDRSTYEAYTPLLAEAPTYCIDPTLLVDLHDIASHKIRRTNYILCYTYTFKPEMIIAVKELASKYNKKIIVVGQNFKWADEAIPASPFEFLGLIENADFIVTDTFHGTVLSIAMNKQFVTAAYKEKVFRLIEQFGLLNRNVDGCASIIDWYENKISYSLINEKIQEARRTSLSYLKSCLDI